MRGDGKQCDRILVTVTLGQTDVTFNSQISVPSRVLPREVQDEMRPEHGPGAEGAEDFFVVGCSDAECRLLVWLLAVCTAPGIIEFVSNAFYEARPSTSSKSKVTLGEISIDGL